MTLGLPVTLTLTYWLREDRWLESFWIGPAISSIFVSLALQVIVSAYTDWQGLIGDQRKRTTSAKQLLLL